MLCRQSYSAEICRTATIITTYVLISNPRDWHWKMHKPVDKHVVKTAKKRHSKCTHTPPNHLDTKERAHKERGRLYPTPIPSYLLGMQSFPRTEKTEKNLFYLHVIASELVGGTRGSKKRGRRKSERCRKGADSSPFENSLNGAAPK